VTRARSERRRGRGSTCTRRPSGDRRPPSNARVPACSDPSFVRPHVTARPEPKLSRTTSFLRPIRAIHKKA
jgi:hypothetical protein